ncbi:Myb-like protein J [Porphyridium purpureum]|uniref:Myb-like protein J n=1 Tax=Porphyridium purpureum TaxID=35688 RepID=A0A5J4YR24_PORPP|nr:Myb-like protein J [Porphyridium purpureum]|eukprot:POR5594..scf222_8
MEGPRTAASAAATPTAAKSSNAEHSCEPSSTRPRLQDSLWILSQAGAMELPEMNAARQGDADTDKQGGGSAHWSARKAEPLNGHKGHEKLAPAAQRKQDAPLFNAAGYRICGVRNNRGGRCGRLGKCPFHHGKAALSGVSDDISEHDSAGHVPAKTRHSATSAVQMDDDNKTVRASSLHVNGDGADVARQILESTSVPAPALASSSTTDPAKASKPVSALGRFKHAWTREEHERFLLALQKFGRGKWKKISAIVETRNAYQCQSHAQKYFNRQSKAPSERKKRSIHDLNWHSIQRGQFQPLSTNDDAATKEATAQPAEGTPPGPMRLQQLMPNAKELTNDARNVLSHAAEQRAIRVVVTVHRNGNGHDGIHVELPLGHENSSDECYQSDTMKEFLTLCAEKLGSAGFESMYTMAGIRISSLDELCEDEELFLCEKEEEFIDPCSLMDEED